MVIITSSYLVVSEHSKLDLLLLVLDLLGGGVILLLAFLGATAQAQHQVERRLLLDVVIGERATVFQLLAREDQSEGEIKSLYRPTA